MPRQETQIITDPSLMAYPFTFNRLIPRQGYEITVTFPLTAEEMTDLLAQGKTSNPAQVEAALAAGEP